MSPYRNGRNLSLDLNRPLSVLTNVRSKDNCGSQADMGFDFKRRITFLERLRGFWS